MQGGEGKIPSVCRDVDITRRGSQRQRIGFDRGTTVFAVPVYVCSRKQLFCQNTQGQISNAVFDDVSVRRASDTVDINRNRAVLRGACFHC